MGHLLKGMRRGFVVVFTLLATFCGFTVAHAETLSGGSFVLNGGVTSGTAGSLSGGGFNLNGLALPIGGPASGGTFQVNPPIATSTTAVVTTPVSTLPIPGGGFPPTPPPVPLTSTTTSATAFGRAFPGARIVIGRDGGIIDIVIADAAGRWVSTTVTGSGLATLSFFGIDNDARRTPVVVLVANLSGGQNVTLPEFILAPTIGSDKVSVKRGETIDFSGYALPGSFMRGTITASVGGATLPFIAEAGSDGAWNFTLHSEVLAKGDYTIKIQETAPDNTTSGFSEDVAFTVGDVDVATPPPSAPVLTVTPPTVTTTPPPVVNEAGLPVVPEAPAAIGTVVVPPGTTLTTPSPSNPSGAPVSGQTGGTQSGQTSSGSGVTGQGSTQTTAPNSNSTAPIVIEEGNPITVSGQAQPFTKIYLYFQNGNAEPTVVQILTGADGKYSYTYNGVTAGSYTTWVQIVGPDGKLGSKFNLLTFNVVKAKTVKGVAGAPVSSVGAKVGLTLIPFLFLLVLLVVLRLFGLV